MQHIDYSSRIIPQASQFTVFDYTQIRPGLKWSEKGQMIVDGNKVVGTNIVDLINDLSRNRSSNRLRLECTCLLENFRIKMFQKNSFSTKNV